MQTDEKQAAVPYFVHEGQMARMERIIKNLSITIVAALAVALIMFVINNVIWLNYVKQHTAATTSEVSADAGVYNYPDQGADR